MPVIVFGSNWIKRCHFLMHCITEIAGSFCFSQCGTIKATFEFWAGVVMLSKGEGGGGRKNQILTWVFGIVSFWVGLARDCFEFWLVRNTENITPARYLRFPLMYLGNGHNLSGGGVKKVWPPIKSMGPPL